MKVRVDGTTYQTEYEPFFRLRTHDSGKGDYFKYGIRWPDGYIEHIFFDRGKDQINEMRLALIQSLKVYYLGANVNYMNEHEKRMYDNVKRLFGIRR